MDKNFSNISKQVTHYNNNARTTSISTISLKNKFSTTNCFYILHIYIESCIRSIERGSKLFQIGSFITFKKKISRKTKLCSTQQKKSTPWLTMLTDSFLLLSNNQMFVGNMQTIQNYLEVKVYFGNRYQKLKCFIS